VIHIRIEALHVNSSDLAASEAFLRAVLPGLSSTSSRSSAGLVRFSSRPSPIAATDGNPFWKFSVFTDDLDELRAQIIDHGTAVSEPVQFGDIGYLCHLGEPGGVGIELLQRTFQSSPRVLEPQPNHLGLITLRIDDPEESAMFYEQGLGLRLLATMAVDSRENPFDLYFFGPATDEPPSSDPSAVVNREWLYQRETTVIELQHFRRPVVAGGHRAQVESTLHHITISTNQIEQLEQELQAIGTESTDTTDGGLMFESPDGHRFECTPHPSG